MNPRAEEDTDRRRQTGPLRTVPAAPLSTGEAQPSAGFREKGHCSPVPLSSPAETLCSVAFMLAERLPEERLGDVPKQNTQPWAGTEPGQ